MSPPKQLLMSAPPSRSASTTTLQERQSHKIQKPLKKQPTRIIYIVPPEVIHVEANEFTVLVQRLTGNSTACSSSPAPPTSLAGAHDSAVVVQSSTSRGGSQILPVRVKASRALSLRSNIGTESDHHQQQQQLSMQFLPSYAHHALSHRDSDGCSDEDHLLSHKCSWLDNTPETDPAALPSDYVTRSSSTGFINIFQ